MLMLLFLAAVISLSLLFCVYSSSAWIVESTQSSMLTRPLPPSFLETYSLSVSSLGCSALCIVISFLVLWSICRSSSLVHFKNGPEYLIMGTAHVFIPLKRFLLQSLVSKSFLVLLRYYYYYYHYYYYYFTPWEIFTPIILADFNRAVVWIVSILPLISNSLWLFSRPFGTVPRAPITIGTTFTHMFHSFFSSLARSKYLSFFSISFSFTL